MARSFSSGTAVIVRHYQMALARRANVVFICKGARRKLNRRRCYIFVGNYAQYVPDAVQPGAPLIFRFNLVPARIRDVGVAEHYVLSLGELYPLAARLDVYRAQ